MFLLRLLNTFVLLNFNEILKILLKINFVWEIFKLYSHPFKRIHNFKTLSEWRVFIGVSFPKK